MTVGIDSKILRSLGEWEEKEGALPKPIELYRRLLCLQSEAESRIGVPRLDLSGEAISRRIECGSPLLEFDDLSIDWSLLRDIFQDVTAVVVSYSDVLGETPGSLGNFSSSLPLLKDVIKSWFEGSQFPPWLKDNSVNETLLELTIHATLRPFLASHREAFLSLVNQESWRRGYCPICGGSPDFAFLDKEQGARWLLCSRCDTEWLFQRLECPYCGNQDQNALAYFTDDKGLFRLYVCERCRHYLKAIDLRRSEHEVLLPLERFLTIDIDTQACKEGYTPGLKARQGEEMERRSSTTVLTREES